MAETTTPRLMAAAKEFNVGKETLVDFLLGKGFSKDDLKPTSKLTDEMYRALQAEFQSDKVAKLKSEQIDLPKGAAAEAKRKRDEEEIVFRKEEKKAPAQAITVSAPKTTTKIEAKPAVAKTTTRVAATTAVKKTTAPAQKTNATTAHLKKDGTPDKRYKENKKK